jgi:hypothetical protein
MVICCNVQRKLLVAERKRIPTFDSYKMPEGFLAIMWAAWCKGGHNWRDLKRQIIVSDARFEVVTAVLLKMQVVWGISSVDR